MPPKKAKAPAVKSGGHEAARERRAAAKNVRRVTAPDVCDLDFFVALNSVSMGTRRRVRVESGQPLELFLFAGGIGIDTYAHLWWVSRLEAGEDVSLTAAESEWDERYGTVQIVDIVEADGGDGTDPN